MPQVVLAAVAVGTSIKQSSDSKKAREQSNALAAEQARKQDEQIKAIEKKQQEEISGSEKTRVRDEARQRQQQLAAGATGRRSTILTSPIGVTGEQTVASQRKTLIGA